MKQIFNTGWIVIPILTIICFTACKQNSDLVYFDQDKSYVYFGLPNEAYRPVEKFIDTIDYSFALDVPGVMEKTVAIPVNVSGVASSESRNYAFVIDEDSSYYDKNLIELSSPVIGANKLVDTLYLKIKNGEALRDTIMKLKIRLVDNENFVLGHKFNQTIRIKFTNQLLEPRWWFAWRNYFGTTYYPEIYQKWIQIYYKYADPSPDLYNPASGAFYYWGNMPSSANTSWYPVTFMYISVLKKYFAENPVYPNGDITQPRILLP